MSIDHGTVGSRIRAARKRKGISQAELAERVGVTSAYISYLENGERNMSVENFIEIVCALNISADELLIDILPNKIRSTSQEMLTLLSDCNEFEGRVLLAVLRGAKTALRETLRQDPRRY